MWFTDGWLVAIHDKGACQCEHQICIKTRVHHVLSLIMRAFSDHAKPEYYGLNLLEHSIENYEMRKKINLFYI